MIRISQLKLKVGHTREELFEEIIHQAHGKRPVSWQIVRKSVDARKKPQLFYVYTIDAEFENEKKLLSAKKSKWTKPSVSNYTFPYSNSKEAGMSFKEEKLEERPVIVGMGPAGLFAALVLARAGFAPVVFERGDCVETRSEVVEHFFETGELDEESNVQFGEGGAGTFSDGKLNTLVKDKFGRNHFVLKEFVKHGAPEDILYEAKPHIGTDILKDVVASIRKEIESLGGEVHFRTKVCDILCEDIAGIKEDEAGKVHEQEITAGRQNSQIKGLLIEKDSVRTKYPCRNVIFAIGHSARDTFYMLHEKKLFMTPKAFAIGVRVEHPAYLINESQYGKEYPEELPTASYKLTHQCESTGRGIYSFCMCPGGVVMASSSEKNTIVSNGMSNFLRNGKNANSALLVNVVPNDFPSESPLSGIYFQKDLEEKAFVLGGSNYYAPIQRVEDFLQNKKSTFIGKIQPTYLPGVTLSNLNDILPEFVSSTLKEGILYFNNKLEGFANPDSILTGVETRSSSPVKIVRNESLVSNIIGLYPCGEGARLCWRYYVCSSRWN